jgi:adenylate cyclase
MAFPHADMPTTRAGARVGLLLRALRWGAAIGAVIGGTSGHGMAASQLGTLFGALAGAIQGLLLAGAIFGAELFLPTTRLGQALERAPFLVDFAAKFVAYGAVIALVIGTRPGWQLASAIAQAWPHRALAAGIAAKIATPTAPSMALAVLILGAGIFLLQVSRLIGDRTLRDIVRGRYHRPRTEERFFLFVDIVGSTPLAERIGPDAVHRFLGDVFRLASDPIDHHGGEVYQYVGDEIVITWPVAEGRPGARPIACCFAIEQALARAASQFERDFGAAPRLRAALHGGTVMTGEVGGSRRAIVYHGDVVNTTSRIEQATRDLGRPFLVSEDALQRLGELRGVAVEDMGVQQLRGRVAGMRVYAVSANGAANAGREGAAG